MRPVDGSGDEMDDLGHMSDADLDRLLAGKAGGGADDAEALAAFFHEVRSRYVTQPSSATREDHLSKILAAARLNAEPGQPSAEPSPTEEPGHRPRWRKRLVLGSIFGGSITAKIALIGVVAATAATGGLAAAGSLPSALQSAVAGAAGNVGVRIPNPQATAKANAQVQAGKVASTVDQLVEEVATAAEQAPKLTTSTVASTQACTQNVETIASQLLGSAAGTSNPALAQSLAERATALAQESVGCALPAIGSVATPPPGTKSTDADTARDTAAAKAISGAIQGCATPLRSAIQTLVQAAIMARTGAQLQALAQDAKAVATAAQGCAQGVGSALQGVLSNLPMVAAPKTPTGTTPTPGGNGWSGLFNLVPNLPKGQPSGAPTPGTPAPKGTTPSNPAAWWTQLLSQFPSQIPKAGSTSLPGMPGTPSPGSGSWSGLTGSWNGSGSWSPYPSASPTPGPKQQSDDSRESTRRH
ncbi:MAG: hypothetical protein QOD01_128 [Actinomycetota bacterium]|nr:hypothetical protein [Actinomycetota bacterium]